MNKTQSSDPGVVDFLIAHYNAIHEETMRTRTAGIERLNFYVTLTTAVGGGLVLLVQLNPTATAMLKSVALLAVVFLILIGSNTMRFVISREINTDRNVRASGRIIRYFANHSPEIESYLTWNTHDKPTKWITSNSSGLRRSVQSLLSSQIGILAGLATFFANGDILTAAASFLVVSVLSYFLFGFYAKRRFLRAVQLAEEQSRFDVSID